VLNKTVFTAVYYSWPFKTLFLAEFCNLLFVYKIISLKQERRVHNYYYLSSDVFLLYKLSILKPIKRPYLVNLGVAYFFPPGAKLGL
jgi:hypothetical protein